MRSGSWSASYRVAQNLVRRVNQIAKSRLLFDDARVVLDVGRARYTVGERRDVCGPADFIQIAAARQFFFQRDEVDRLVPLIERDHPIEDAPMRVTIEIAGVDDLCGEIEGVVVDEDRAEHRTLGFEIVRKRALRSSNDGVGHE